MEPASEGLGSEGGDAALLRNPRNHLRDVAQERQLRGQIDQARNIRSQTRPEVDIAEGIGAARAHAAFVVMREEFSFVGRDVDAHRTVALASLAGEAEIERVLDLFAAPAIANDLALGHFPEQMSAAARGVLLFMCGAPTRTHHAAFIAAAFADPNAAQSAVR